MPEFLTNYSPLWLLLAPLSGVLFAWLFYRDTRNKLSRAWYLYPLVIFRGIVVTILVLMLLNPFLKTQRKRVDRPLLVVAIDQSRSMLFHTDSLQQVKRLQNWLAEAKNRLEGDFDLRIMGFGDEAGDSIRWRFDQQATDFSRLFQRIEDRYAGQRLAAILLASDGIYNQGAEPLSQSSRLNVSLYCFGLGDTHQPRDLSIMDLRVNRTSFVGTEFPISVDLQASLMQGAEAEVSLEKVEAGKGILIDKRSFNINSGRYFENVLFTAPSGQAGMHRYRIRAVAKGGDELSANDVREFFVEVVDARTSILLLGHGAHPDMGCIREALEKSPLFEVNTAYSFDQPQIKAGTEAVIVHQLPSSSSGSAAWMKQIEGSGLPVWFIAGAYSNISLLNSAQALVRITTQRGGVNSVLPSVIPDFALFTLEDELKKAIVGMPPLEVPFGTYSKGPAAVSLLNQKVGSMSTDMPLWALAPNARPRQAFLLGEGIWRWRLAQAEKLSEMDALGELVRRTTQFLSVKPDDRPFQLRTIQRLFREQDDVVFEGVLYNKNREQVNESDVQVNLISEEGQQYSYMMGKSGKGYRLNVGGLAAGNYRYRGTASLAGERFEAEGAFAVERVNLEQTRTAADHEFLSQLSAKSGGRFVAGGDGMSLFNDLRKDVSSTAVTYLERTLSELISLEILLILLGLFLSAEWMLRRYAGIY
ncbi:MAG: VWA domain-containing protein [Sphingomonadales bacterium]|nr:VWA domain-containing protein [Sphingomonadales bacterium]